MKAGLLLLGLGNALLRTTLALLLLTSVLGIDCIKRGPFGEEEVEVEDHKFLIEFKNTTRVSVGFREDDTGRLFVVEGTDSGFIQRTAQPGQVLRFAASTGTFLSEPVSCTYQPPSDQEPARRVEWDGNVIRCHFWEANQ